MSKTSSLIGKRRRSSEDEVLYDNYHKHKRFLTEVMASSMNGLSVCEAGSSQPGSTDGLVSPAHTETGCPGVSRSGSSFPSLGDDMSTLDSPMSEESDESVGYRLSRGVAAPRHCVPSSSDFSIADTTSPCRFERPACFSTAQTPSRCLAWTISRIPSVLSTSPYTPSSWPNAEGRLPPSPNDACQFPDLRRATLLRNLQLKAEEPTQQRSAASTPESKKPLEEPDSVEEGEYVSSPHLTLYSTYEDEYGGDQNGITASPSPCVYSNQVVRGSHRVRLCLEDSMTSKPKATSCSHVKDGERCEGLQTPVLVKEEKSPKKRRSPRRRSENYDATPSFTLKDGNISDTESTFVRGTENPTDRPSKQSFVCSEVESGYPSVEGQSANNIDL